MQVGTTKDQGSYNKPSAAVHPGALAAGTLLQYNTINTHFFRWLHIPTGPGLPHRDFITTLGWTPLDESSAGSKYTI